MQDTFLRAFEARNTLAPESNLGAWLVVVAKNRCRDVLRKRKRETALQENAEARSAYAQPERDEIYRMLWDQVHNLEPDAREVLLLYYVSRKRIRAIAHLLDITPGAAAKRLQRARSALGQRMVDTIGREVARTLDRKDGTHRVMAVLAANLPGFSAGAARAGTSITTGLLTLKHVVLVGAVVLMGVSAYLAFPKSAPETPSAKPDAPMAATSSRTAS